MGRLPAAIAGALAGLWAGGCSWIADFPGDCDPATCDGGLTCEADGVQCRDACRAPEHCRDGFRCEVATGACRPGPGGGGDGGGAAGEGEGEGEGGVGGDRDGDGVADALDRCPGVADPRNGDGDGDGVGDVCDVCPIDPDSDQADQDGDGAGDSCDNCPAVPNADEAARLDPDRDGVGAACDNCPGDPNREQDDRDADGMGDACDPCPDFADTDLRPEDCESAIEPPEPNGHPGATVLVATPAAVRGAIGPRGVDAYTAGGDADVYLVRARHGRVLRVTARATGGLLQPVMDVRPLLRAGPAVHALPAGGQAVVERLADRTETWVVRVSDLQGGGAMEGHEYTLLLEDGAAAGLGVALPFTEVRPLPAAAGADALRLTPGAAGMLAVSIEAGAPTAAGASMRLVREGDGRVIGAGEVEAVAWVEAPDVVHAVWSPGPGAPAEGEATWRARLHLAPGLADGADPARPSPARPLVPDGPALEGVLSGVGAAGVDRDLYGLVGRAGAGFRVMARPIGASPARPALLLRDLEGTVLWRSTPGEDGLTRLEGVFPADERYELEVTDERNTGGERTTGGPDHAYAIALASFDVPEVSVPPPGTATVRLDRPGAIAKVVVPASFDRWVTVTASSRGGAIAPLLTVLHPDEGLITRGVSYVAFRPPAFRGYVVIVSDLLGRGGAGEAVEVITRAAQLVTFQEAGESPDAAQAGLATRAVHGVLDSAGNPPDTVDDFVVTAPIGATLFGHALAVPEAGSVRRQPDVRVSLLDVRRETVLAAGGGGAATPPVPADVGQRYVVRVELVGQGRAEYAVVAEAAVCPQPAGVLPAEEGQVRVWEVLGEVGAADANADGLPGAEADRFVEIGGVVAGPVGVGGYVLEGAEGRRVWLPCGLALSPGPPAVLFGGGRPWGAFGGAAVYTVERFGILPGPGDDVVVKDTDRAVIAREVVGGAGAGVSRHWDGAGWVDHGQAPGAQGPYSPGARPGGESYTLGGPCTDDGDCGMTEACVPEADLPAGAVVRSCRPRQGPFAAGLPCQDGAACASAVCEPPSSGGEAVCRAPCEDDGVCGRGSRCYADEWAFRFAGGDDGTATDDRWEASPACAPDRGSGRPCASFPDCEEGEVCVPVPQGDRLDWRRECRRPRGAAGHGVICAADRECKSGVCARIPGTDTSVCLGACLGDGDCAFGTCRQQPMPTDDHGTPGEPADDRAAPLTACFP